ncbi:Uma2 family endonuclease [Streptomyces luteolifulvus]|uniref:Uma2 family endonuclease n=1 Tax=Streptomyces luteolifulvus TaxID=2615112 RepID=A0A6H9V072_9ACTN|nr:Uma2 family endonuclease [Streptomyces luteolifulvus]KAB1147263.1 Uma2 family endonuclease [Streptomyces luteolifulvus]
MTVVDDRIAMADANTKRLDEWFERLERMPVPEGFRVEIVGGNIYMTPQRDTHWEIIRRIVRVVEDRFGMDVKVLSDVRIDFPGHENGFCPDVAMLSASAAKDDEGRWRHEDVEFVAEVISRGTAANDYGPKRTAYALAEVPVYLIVDPYQGECRLHVHPRDGAYAIETKISFGEAVDLTDTVLGLTLKTHEFPRG